MKISFIKPLFALILFAASVGLVFAQTSPQTDYQFQMDQYRRYYAEYFNFKRDYDTRPSLENEQKAILAAKQTIIARELAWANFYLVLIQAIREPAVTYPLIDKAATDLNAIVTYHFNQANLAQNIVTRSDLTTFTQEELKVLPSHGLPSTRAQVAIKIARLIKLQIEAKAAYDSLLPRLAPVKDEISVINGLSQIEDYSRQITTAIDALSKTTIELSFETANQPRFLEETSLALSEIRTLQRRLVDVIIDLDTNYVTR